MHLKNENERNMFMHLENMMMIPFSAPLAPLPCPNMTNIYTRHHRTDKFS